MEEISLNFNNLNTLLNEFINDFINTYKSYLIRDKKNASGNLISSIQNLSIRFEGNQIVGEISLASYWKYIEYGRKPGKFPPPNAILSWVKTKPILPRPMNGLKAPSDKQLAFLIGRKIARDGIKPGNQFNQALNDTWERWKDRISQAISIDIQTVVNKF